MFAALREQAAAAAEHAAAAAAQAAEQASSLSLSEATSRLSIATSSLQFFPEDGAPPEAAPSSDEPYAGTVKFDLDDEPAPAPSAAAPVPVTPGKPALDVLCAQQRRALEAGEQRIRALVEELNSTKLKALKRMREKVLEYSESAGEGAKWPLCANILDPVRASVVCSGPAEILDVLVELTDER